MKRRIGFLVLIAGAGVMLLQPVSAFAGEREDRYYGHRYERHREHEWREHQLREHRYYRPYTGGAIYYSAPAVAQPYPGGAYYNAPPPQYNAPPPSQPVPGNGYYSSPPPANNGYYDSSGAGRPPGY